MVRCKLFEKPVEITNKMLKELSEQGECVVLCYNQAEVWKSRDDAVAFYLEAMHACEGCEAERYMNVYCDLVSGMRICHDGVTEILVRETDYR